MSDPRMSLTLADCVIETDGARARRAGREARDADVPYLGRRPIAPDQAPQTIDQWCDEVADGVARGLRKKLAKEPQ